MDLPYRYDALEPYIDAKTMEIHHGKHHAAYLSKLNQALEGHPHLQMRTVETLLRTLDEVPEGIRTTVRNNGGGVHNHDLFWQIMGPGKGGEPKGRTAEILRGGFGGFSDFKAAFSKAAVERFGSGWAWLVRTPEGLYAILSTPNQDSPVMERLVPVLGLDVWEHAYYLKYQNRRAEYVQAWWNVVNWDEVERRVLQT
jgi:Fe-Mn family superoxide dismutase